MFNHNLHGDDITVPLKIIKNFNEPYNHLGKASMEKIHLNKSPQKNYSRRFILETDEGPRRNKKIFTTWNLCKRCLPVFLA
jgi:hypothetical protein